MIAKSVNCLRAREREREGGTKGRPEVVVHTCSPETGDAGRDGQIPDTCLLGEF